MHPNLKVDFIWLKNVYSASVFSAEHDLHNRFAGKIRFWPPGAKKGAKMAKNLCFLNEKQIMPKSSEKYVDSWKNKEK